MEKYKLTDESIECMGRKLFRIVALRDFAGIKCGDLGGFVESVDNLSQFGNAWVCDDAKVFDNARVSGNALIGDNAYVFDNACVGDNAYVFDNANVYDTVDVYNNARIYGNARVFGLARVFGSASVCSDATIHGTAKVYGYAKVCGEANLCGNATVCNMADYIVFKNWWSSGRYFTWTRSNNMWSVGCFYGTGAELVKKAYADSEKSGIEYERIVNYVENTNNRKHKKHYGIISYIINNLFCSVLGRRAL